MKRVSTVCFGHGEKINLVHVRSVKVKVRSLLLGRSFKRKISGQSTFQEGGLDWSERKKIARHGPIYLFKNYFAMSAIFVQIIHAHSRRDRRP